VYSGNCDLTQCNNNIFVAGASGAGKSFSIIEPALTHTRNTSVVLTGSKRSLMEKYLRWFKDLGYKVFDVNFVHPERSSVAYDPLRYVKSYTDIKHLAMSVVMADPQKAKSNADPYWDKGGASLLSALIAYTMMTKNKPTFADVLDLLDTLEIDDRNGVIKTNLDDKFDRVKLKDPNCFAVTNWRTFKQLPIKTASCIFSTLNSTVDDMFTPELRQMMRKSTPLDFTELGKSRCVLFITTSAVNNALHRFVNMFNGQMLKDLFEYAEEQPDGCLKVPVRLMFDDFAVGSRILNFPEMISILRAKKISCLLLCQSESQIQSMYSESDAVTIINNCDTYIYLGGMDLSTCKNVSQRLNAPLEDVLYMPIGQEFIFRRGQRPVVTERYHTPEDPVWKGIGTTAKGSRLWPRECA
jgi:type IV secretory pathway TraG/TraD family ATPase VirD4